MRIIITGGTGLIGTALAQSLVSDDHEVIVLSRTPGKRGSLPDSVQMEYWDAQNINGWAHLVDGADAVVHLAGANVAGEGFLPTRWTPKRKRVILESRLNTGKAVVEAVKAAKDKPKVVIQASAVGYYGPQEGSEALTEEAPPANDFLAQVCVEWEASTEPVEKLGVRRAVIRTGVVLSNEGGAFTRQKLLFQMFAGGPIGSGEQWYPWIHIQDEVKAIRFLLENENASGPFNLAAPNAVTNGEFSKAVGKVMQRPSWLPAPGFAFQMAFGEVASILLEGQRVAPKRLQDLDFEFDFPEVEPALADILK